MTDAPFMIMMMRELRLEVMRKRRRRKSKKRTPVDKVTRRDNDWTTDLSRAVRWREDPGDADVTRANKVAA